MPVTVRQRTLDLTSTSSPQERRPLSGGEDDHSGFRMLGVPDSGRTSEVGNFDATAIDSAIAALAPQFLFKHSVHSSKDLMMSLMYESDCSWLNAVVLTSSNTALNSLSSFASSMKREETDVST